MNTKTAFLAILGRPNVGKSTLLNALVGEKVAIVTPKPQTTRSRVTGVLTEGETQLVFFDTPGIHRPRTRLSEYMVRQIRDSVSGVDAAVLVTEPLGEIQSSERELVADIAARKLPALLVVNKIDRLPRKELMMEKINEFSKLYNFEHTVPISAQRRDGVPLLLELLKGYAAEGPHYFDADAYTDQPERVIAAELIREKLLKIMRDEIPHGVAVGIESMKARQNGDLTDIQALIYCEKESHKAMLIGKKGENLKTVATQARIDIEKLLDTKVNLQCWVKVKEDWRNKEGSLREFGFN
jgi:GTP-binding protein Era